MKRQGMNVRDGRRGWDSFGKKALSVTALKTHPRGGSSQRWGLPARQLLNAR